MTPCAVSARVTSPDFLTVSAASAGRAGSSGWKGAATDASEDSAGVAVSADTSAGTSAEREEGNATKRDEATAIAATAIPTATNMLRDTFKGVFFLCYGESHSLQRQLDDPFDGGVGLFVKNGCHNLARHGRREAEHGECIDGFVGDAGRCRRLGRRRVCQGHLA